MKNAFYLTKKALFVLEIFIFLYFSLPLFFFPVGHRFRVWSKTIVKVYYVIDCLSKNLRYYATFKVRKFESLFYKINAYVQKTTTYIGLQAEKIPSVNI